MTVTEFTIEHKSTSVHPEWDVRDFVFGVIDWTTDKDYSAGELSFSLKLPLEDVGTFNVTNGDIVRFQWNGVQIFYGKIFKWDIGEDYVANCTAYDNLRFLKSEDTIVFPVSTGTERFVRIMQIMNLKYRNANLAIAKLDAKVYDGETYFSMLQDALDQTNKITKDGDFFMRAVWDTIELKQVYSTGTTLVVEGGGLLSKWNYQQSADELYNLVKVVKDITSSDEKDETRKTFSTTEAQAGDSIVHYGRLSKVEKAEKEMNEAQMRDKANQLLTDLNKEDRLLSLTAVGTFHSGNSNIRAGDRFTAKIDYPLISYQYNKASQVEVLAEKVTHHFSDNWLMDLDCRILKGG